MKRWDFTGGLWLRVSRWWIGLIPAFPFVWFVPVIAGGIESQALAAQGTYMVIGDGASPEGWTEIAEVTSFGGPSISRENIDVTHLRSAGNFREFLASFVDPGEITMRIQYNPSAHPTHVTLSGLLSVSTNRNFRLVFPDASSWDFQATVSGFALTGAEVGGKIEVDVTLKVSGLVDFSGAGSPS